MNLEIGDLISFNELPNNLPFGIEAKIVNILEDGTYIAHLVGTDQILLFSDLYGSWDSKSQVKVDRFYDSIN